ncbi:hypothetical protein GCM10027295_20150 [Pseudaeromonas pectinilytica]
MSDNQEEIEHWLAQLAADTAGATVTDEGGKTESTQGGHAQWSTIYRNLNRLRVLPVSQFDCVIPPR